MPRISQGGARRPCRARTACDGKRLELFFLTVERDKAIEFLQRGSGSLEPYELPPAAVSPC